MPHDPISFDTNGLYILLTDLGQETLFHWAFYLAKSPNHGEVFQLVNNITTRYEWKYQQKPTVDAPNAVNLLAALKIAVMDPILHDPLATRLPQVSQTPPVTCRVWLKRALEELDEEGYIELLGSVDRIEEQAADLAFKNKLLRRRSVGKCDFSVA